MRCPVSMISPWGHWVRNSGRFMAVLHASPAIVHGDCRLQTASHERVPERVSPRDSQVPLGEGAMMRAAGPAGVVRVGCLLGPATAADVRYRGGKAELTVSAVSDRTVQVVLAPLDDKGKPRPAPPSTVLVEQKPQLKLRTRELAKAREVSAGKLRVRGAAQ